MIYTGSYGRVRHFHAAPVRISLGKPRELPPGRWRWPYFAELAPRPWYWRRDRAAFERYYTAQLDRFEGDILAKLSWLTDALGPIILCCWERPPLTDENWCHRRMAAAWLQAHLGIEVPEIRK